jgi:hypothetical protein
MLYLPNPHERPDEPSRAVPGETTWEDVRTCAVVLKNAGATPLEIVQRIVDMGIEEPVAFSLVMALFPPPPKKRSRHGKKSVAAKLKSDPARLDEAYLAARAAESDAETAGPPEPRAARCDHCRRPIAAGLGQVRIKSESELLGNVVQSRTLRVMLCPACAADHDAAHKYLVRVLWVLGGAGAFAMVSNWLTQLFRQ